MPLPVASSTLVVKIKAKKQYAAKIACNCYAYVKAHYPSLPHMVDIEPNTKAKPGAVAIFDYGDMMHFAIVTNVNKRGFEQIESNYHRCKVGSHFVYWEDPHLVGFWTS